MSPNIKRVLQVIFQPELQLWILVASANSPKGWPFLMWPFLNHPSYKTNHHAFQSRMMVYLLESRILVTHINSSESQLKLLNANYILAPEVFTT